MQDYLKIFVEMKKNQNRNKIETFIFVASQTKTFLMRKIDPHILDSLFSEYQ